VGLAACSDEGERSSGEATASNTATSATQVAGTSATAIVTPLAGVDLGLSATQPGSPAGGTVVFRLVVTNQTSSVVRLEFPTAQQFELVVRDAGGRELWKWSNGRAFAQAFTHFDLAAGGRQTIEAAWENAGAPGLALPATLTAEATLLSVSGQAKATMTFDLRP
jgi:hypothetical protein